MRLGRGLGTGAGSHQSDGRQRLHHHASDRCRLPATRAIPHLHVSMPDVLKIVVNMEASFLETKVSLNYPLRGEDIVGSLLDTSSLHRPIRMRLIHIC